MGTREICVGAVDPLKIDSRGILLTNKGLASTRPPPTNNLPGKITQKELGKYTSLLKHNLLVTNLLVISSYI